MIHVIEDFVISKNLPPKSNAPVPHVWLSSGGWETWSLAG